MHITRRQACIELDTIWTIATPMRGVDYTDDVKYVGKSSSHNTQVWKLSAAEKFCTEGDMQKALTFS